MFERAQDSKSHDDRQSQRGLILLYALLLPIFAYYLFHVINHWHTPGYDHGWNLAWVLMMGFSAMLNIAVRMVRLRKLPA